jgi:hypothetical protein
LAFSASTPSAPTAVIVGALKAELALDSVSVLLSM